MLLAGGCSALGTAAPPAGDDGSLPICTATVAKPLANGGMDRSAGGSGRALRAVMQFARVQPRVLVLDSGTVLIALGWDEAGKLVAEVERFDPSAEEFSDVRADLPEHADAAVTALEGDRVFYIGCDGAGAACEVRLLVPHGDGGFASLRADFAGAWLAATSIMCAHCRCMTAACCSARANARDSQAQRLRSST